MRGGTVRTGKIITTTINATVRAPRTGRCRSTKKNHDLLLHGMAEDFQAVGRARLTAWRQRRRILGQHAVALDHPPAVLAGLIDNAIVMQRVAPATDQLQQPDGGYLGEAAC